MRVDTQAARELCEALGYLHGSGPEIRLWMHAMADELDALRRDAERYRWLREREVEIRRYATVGQQASERLDNQIDAAIEEARAVGAA